MWLRVSAALFLAFAITVAPGDVIVDQPYDGTSDGRTSQEFPDFPDFSTFQLDDLTTVQDWYLTTLTAPGTDAGDPNETNVDVVARIWDGLPEQPGCGTTGQIVLEAHGTENAETATLTFDFGGELLPAGTYWVGVYVVRNFGDHGIWRWLSTTPVSGSEAYYFNPGGALGYGDCPISGTERYGETRDLVFTLEGTPAGGCPGDIDGDGDTDLGDLAMVLSAYGSAVGDPNYDAGSDFDGDGDVDLADLAFLLADYGCSP